MIIQKLYNFAAHNIVYTQRMNIQTFIQYKTYLQHCEITRFVIHIKNYVNILGFLSTSLGPWIFVKLFKKACKCLYKITLLMQMIAEVWPLRDYKKIIFYFSSLQVNCVPIKAHFFVLFFFSYFFPSFNRNNCLFIFLTNILLYFKHQTHDTSNVSCPNAVQSLFFFHEVSGLLLGQLLLGKGQLNTFQSFLTQS